MPASEIRKEAREALKGNWGKGACIILAYLAFCFVLGLIEELFQANSFIYLLIEIAVLVMSAPLSFGLIIAFMKLKRGEEISAFGFLKEGFSRFKKSWGIYLQILKKLLLPMLCLIVLIILIAAMISYSTVSALTDNSMSNSGSLALALVFTVVYIACLVYIIARSLLYVLAYNIGYDNPELSSKDCVLKSEELMKGNRGNYFILDLSFIGWALLACLTFGIGMLWLLPYMQVSMVCFYERLAKPEVKEVDGEVKIEE